MNFVTYRTIALTAAFVSGLAVTSALADTVKRDVVYVPTPQEVVNRMMDMVAVKPTDFVMDLGCGDGRMVVTAAQRGARGFGVDIDPQRIKEANENAEAAKVTDKVTFKVGNLFAESIEKADVLAMYLLTELNLRLRPKILSEMKPGSRVVSHAFDMGEWEPDAHDVVDGKQIYMWHVPAKVDGRWQVENGEQRLTVEFDQSFQMIRGKGQVNGRDATVNGRLTGKDIVFTVTVDGKPQRFEGRVEGGRMEATGGGNWKATRAT